VKTFMVDFQGSLLLQADSEEAAHKKAEEWAKQVEEKGARALQPEVMAVMLRCKKKESDASKKVRKALLAAAATADAGNVPDGDKKSKKQKNQKKDEGGAVPKK
jgi:hypothetical protein